MGVVCESSSVALTTLAVSIGNSGADGVTAFADSIVAVWFDSPIDVESIVGVSASEISFKCSVTEMSALNELVALLLVFVGGYSCRRVHQLAR